MTYITREWTATTWGKGSDDAHVRWRVRLTTDPCAPFEVETPRASSDELLALAAAIEAHA